MVNGPEDGGWQEAREYNLVETEPGHEAYETSHQYRTAYSIASALSDFEEETGEHWRVILREDGVYPVMKTGDMGGDELDYLPRLDPGIEHYEVGEDTEEMYVGPDMEERLEEKAILEELGELP